ncbi:MAG: aspartate dehydrogenase [bacterium]|nr:aspartate dehydrogenase [bacterium]
MKKIGVVGCGTIGKQVCLAIDQGKIAAELVAVADMDAVKARRVVDELTSPCEVLPIPELVRRTDLVVEAASQKVVPTLVEMVLDQGKEALIMSVGGLLPFNWGWDRLAESGARLYIPSGAIAGLDALKAANLSKIYSVTLTTRKPPRGLKGAPYCLEKGIDLDTLDREMVIFEGSAQEATSAFPQNINVAATLSLAGLGPERTRVRIIADPKVSSNIHEIEIAAESGKIVTRTENVPSAVNPKTSYLAVLSAIATIQGIVSPLKVGS